MTMKLSTKQYLLALCMAVMSLIYAYDVVPLPRPWNLIVSLYFLGLVVVNLILGHISYSKDL